MLWSLLKIFKFRFTSEAVNNQQLKELVNEFFEDPKIAKNVEESGMDGDLLDESILENEDSNKLLHSLGMETEELKAKWRKKLQDLKVQKENNYISNTLRNSSSILYASKIDENLDCLFRKF